MVDQAYQYLYMGMLVFLAIGIVLVLIRAIRGPRIADRVMAINMIGTLTIIAIAVLARLLEQSWLLDVCLIYCMISFLSVVVLVKIFITVHLQKQKKQKGAESDA